VASGKKDKRKNWEITLWKGSNLDIKDFKHVNLKNKVKRNVNLKDQIKEKWTKWKILNLLRGKWIKKLKFTKNMKFIAFYILGRYLFEDNISLNAIKIERIRKITIIIST
jgi:hypothetical protein